MRELCPAMDGGTLDGEVGAFHHSVGLRGPRIGEAVFGRLSAGLVEKSHLVGGGTRPTFEKAVGEILPVVSQYGGDFKREELAAMGKEVGGVLRSLPVID